MDQVTVDLRTTEDSQHHPCLKAREGEEASEGKPFAIQDPLEVVAHPFLDTSAKWASSPRGLGCLCSGGPAALAQSL